VFPGRLEPTVAIGISSGGVASSNGARAVRGEKQTKQVRIMTAKRKVAATVALILILGTLPQAKAQKGSPAVPDRERERRSLAINMVRAINTAEASYKKSHGVYASWETFLGNGDFTDTGTKWAPESFPTVAHAMYGRGPEIVPGWKLRLTLSKEGNAYDVLLEDVTDPKCGYAVVSDERGVIRQSKSIDCPL
jgi:hypothetical protein